MNIPSFLYFLPIVWLLNIQITCASVIFEDASCSAILEGHINGRSSQPQELAQLCRKLPKALFDDLEELARLVDISYCVGSTGLREPFDCLNHCKEFEGFELVTTWNTGPLLSDSCGYIALSHEPFAKRIVVAFRGTYSIANTIVDLSVAPQEYLPYPAEDNDDPTHNDPDRDPPPQETKCTNCTVHAGFLTSWRNTRDVILSHLRDARKKHPDYELVLVGHSLGGAVAALAGLELKLRGWNPTVTTFGEPRIGNSGLAKFIDAVFNLDSDKGYVSSSRASSHDLSFRRVTHVGDPIPLLPLEEWGYRMHAGEIFITKQQLSPALEDVQFCDGDADKHCIAGSDRDEVSRPWLSDTELLSALQSFEVNDGLSQNEEEAGINTERNPFPNHQQVLGLHQPRTDDPQPEVGARHPFIPPRYRLLELFRSHRDYFLRIGLCFPSLGGS